MNELDTIKRARMYLAAMSEGKNPLTGQEEGEGSILHQVRIARCLDYVVGILDKVIQNGGEIGPAGRPKKIKRFLPFSLTDEQLDGLTAEPKAISISALLHKVNDLIPPEMKKLSYSQAVSWLVAQGLMEERRNDQGRASHRPTQAGTALGITRQQMMGPSGSYWGNLLSTDAQIFLLTHLREIAGQEEMAATDSQTGSMLNP